MLIPLPLPDEVAAGYFGRLIRLGGFQSWQAALCEVRRHVAVLPTGRSELPLLYLLAQITNMSPQDFCCLHTMLPFFKAFTDSAMDLEYDEIITLNFARYGGMSHPQLGAFVCARCVENDIDLYGYAYFRRQHQLPFALRCRKHKEPLLWKSGNKPFYSSPLDITRSQERPPHYLDISLCDHAVVSRYLSISEAMLSSRRPVPATRIHRVLGGRLRTIARARRKIRRQFPISALAVETCPPDWLSAFMSGLVFDESKQRYPRLDVAMTTKSLTMQSRYYILMLALAFDSTAAALKAIAEDRTDFDCGYVPRKQYFFGSKKRPSPIENWTPAGKSALHILQASN